MRIAAHENWLKVLGEADHANHGIFHLNGLTVEACQAAFDAQYGEGEFVVGDHGTVITVFSYPGYIRERVRKGKTQEEAEAHIQRLKDSIAEKARLAG